MKRWMIAAGSTSLDGMVMQEVPRPEPGAGEVLVKVDSVSLNARDLLLLHGTFGVSPRDFVPVSDGAGEIVAVGAGVDEWVVGDKVTGILYRAWIDGPPTQGQGWGLGSPDEDGMLAEYVVLRAERVAAAPKTLTLEEAACIPCAALTAWTALNGDRPYRNPVRKGDKVLATGTGTVALFSVLFAKAVGATVVVTTSRDSKSSRIRALGASDVINYKTHSNWGEVAFERFEGFQRVVNAGGAGELDQSIAALAPSGEIALMGLYTFASTPPDLVTLMMKAASIRGLSVGSAMAHKDMVDFIDTHGIKPPIAKVFAMSDAPAAYESAASGEPFGKVVIRVAE
ncbi:NAD(P)-dependent alcohol dehydrogenase [Pseudomonas sp. KFB-139]|uniref:NAD(P)-dependent alcohol dehydrogenase n=1 Tax=Pseudomonas serbiensis TaxID=3064350 RepID=A0ABT9CPB6_9PSED|nr:NAD(P)-dependent alcohol dehydrogenase [Pseudomonas sp. KFB-138]MDO7925685.1 NAD(P)-dependent alcohol dehydrogenase [Pseudomonas sp. KFB-138]